MCSPHFFFEFRWKCSEKIRFDTQTLHFLLLFSSIQTIPKIFADLGEHTQKHPY